MEPALPGGAVPLVREVARGLGSRDAGHHQGLPRVRLREQRERCAGAVGRGGPHGLHHERKPVAQRIAHVRRVPRAQEPQPAKGGAVIVPRKDEVAPSYTDPEIRHARSTCPSRGPDATGSSSPSVGSSTEPT